MRGDLLMKVLEIIEVEARTTAELIVATLKSSKTNYLPLKDFYTNAEPILAEKLRQKIKEKQKFYSLFNRLRKDGLIANDVRNGVWKITSAGKEKLESLIAQKRQRPKNYSVIKSPNILIVGFDIPEKIRKKRAWLRSALKNMGFQMIQKSVWMAKVSLPEDFISDLRTAQIFPYVQIFSINKSGTIQNID